MIKTHLIFLFSFCILSTHGQTVRRPVAAVYPGLGAYSSNHVDVFSVQSNQASLAELTSISAGVYGEKRFMLDELSLYQLGIAVPTQSGNFGISAGYFGFNEYNESQVGLAYARKLGEKVNIGVQFNYNGINISGYGNASAVNFEIGATYHLTDKITGGIHLYNPVGGKYGKDHTEKLASIYSAGLGFEVSEKFFISVEFEKEEDQPVNINTGMQYKLIPQLMIRAGISTNTSNVYGGASVFINAFRLDVLASFHPQLGVTPGLLIIYNISKKNSGQ